MDGRLGSEEGLEPGQAHDDGLYQVDVAERLQGLEENPEQLLDLVVGDALGDATEDYQAPGLKGRVVPQREAPGETRPLGQPLAVLNAPGANLHDLQEGLSHLGQRLQAKPFPVRRSGLQVTRSGH